MHVRSLMILFNNRIRTNRKQNRLFAGKTIVKNESRELCPNIYKLISVSSVSHVPLNVRHSKILNDLSSDSTVPSCCDASRPQFGPAGKPFTYNMHLT